MESNIFDHLFLYVFVFFSKVLLPIGKVILLNDVFRYCFWPTCWLYLIIQANKGSEGIEIIFNRCLCHSDTCKFAENLLLARVTYIIIIGLANSMTFPCSSNQSS